MGGSQSVPLDKHIVIVGGGYAGAKLAMSLMKIDANFTLIDVKDCFAHNVANVRAIVEPGMVPKMYIDYSAIFKGFFKRGRVTAIDTQNSAVVLESGERVAYDVLIIGTGCTAAFPTKCWDASKDEATRLFTDYASKIKAASRIAIIGGGAVGVEIAAEIGTDYKDKSVTLIHSSQEMLRPGLRKATHKSLQGILGRLKVKLLLGQKVTNLDEVGESGPFTLKTSEGETVEVDLVITCIGTKVNTSAYIQGLGDCVEENGSLKVNKYLQVEGHDSNIFAIGDCANVKEMKLAVTAEYQADHVLRNIVLKFKDQPLRAYKADNIPFNIVISLGRDSGIGELKLGPILPEFVVTKIKSSHMFVEKFWKSFGLTPPQ